MYSTEQIKEIPSLRHELFAYEIFFVGLSLANMRQRTSVYHSSVAFHNSIKRKRIDLDLSAGQIIIVLGEGNDAIVED
jgi:hypothetical protein